MINLLAAGIAFLGFAALALAMHRHQRHVWHRTLGKGAQVLLRLAGCAGLLASFALCILDAGWTIGPVRWFGWLTATALAVVFMLAVLPRLKELGKDADLAASTSSRSLPETSAG